jgi:hypothetical protein
MVRQAMDATGVKWEEAGALVLRRGPYIIAGGLDDSSAAKTFSLHGRFINLFDASLPIMKEYRAAPGAKALLVDLDAAPAIGIVAAAGRVRDAKVTSNSITFDSDGIGETNGVVCLKIPTAPKTITVGQDALTGDAYDYRDGLLRIRLKNQPEPRRVSIAW